MTNEEEFAARSQPKWAREGDAWILLYRRRRLVRNYAAHSTDSDRVLQCGILARCPPLPFLLVLLVTKLRQAPRIQ